MLPKFLRSEILPYASVEIVRCSDDHSDVYDVRPNATCVDCGTDFSRATNDPGEYCDGCSDRRDRHTSMLQHRLQMATARTRGSAAPKLTPSEISLVVALLGNGYTLPQAIDRIQTLRSRLPFTPSTNEAA